MFLEMYPSVRPKVGDIIKWDGTKLNGPDYRTIEYFFVIKVEELLGEIDMTAWNMTENYFTDEICVNSSNERGWSIVSRMDQK
jgi:hypothetical protein